MAIFEWTIALLVAAVVAAALARRIGLPYPSLLALLGTLIVFVPGAPALVLEPELALALFVAPVLLDAAFDASVRDLRANYASVVNLALVAVLLTTAAVAVTLHALVPALPWAAAVAAGAIVAPPDAAAATAVLKESPVPHRLVQILEGESLFNDASALLIFRLAVAVAMGAQFTLAGAVPSLALALVGSVALGFAGGALMSRVVRRVEDAPSSIVLQFAGTFGAWIAAERLGLSGILTVVVLAFTTARRAPDSMPARIRVPSYAVWDTVVFVLNALAFVLIGLQLGPILSRLPLARLAEYGGIAAAVLAVVIGTRVAWVMGYGAFVRWRCRAARDGRTHSPLMPTVAGGVIVSWCGMRGIVTIAAALALPDGDRPFPGRELILIVAFAVVLGTLVLQGLTLRPLLAWLDVRDDGPVDRELALAHKRLLKRAFAVLDGDTSAPAEALRTEFRALWLPPHVRDPASVPAARHYRELRSRTTAALRDELVDLRRTGTIGDDAFHRIEEEIDRAELYAAIEAPLTVER